MCTHAFHWYQKSITLDDLERINGRFRIIVSFEMAILASLRKNLSQTISNIWPRILLTINRKSTGNIDELIIICQGSLYMHCCRASPLLQLGFLVINCFDTDGGVTKMSSLWEVLLFLPLWNVESSTQQFSCCDGSSSLLSDLQVLLVALWLPRWTVSILSPARSQLCCLVTSFLLSVVDAFTRQDKHCTEWSTVCHVRCVSMTVDRVQLTLNSTTLRTLRSWLCMVSTCMKPRYPSLSLYLFTVSCHGCYWSFEENFYCIQA